MNSVPGLYFIMVWPDRARFVRPDTEDALHTIGSVAFTTLWSDAGPADPNSPPGSEQTNFLTLLASRIGEDLSADLFTHLVLVAPPAILQELLDLLDAPTTQSLVGTLARDLMKLPDLELWPHLLPWLQPCKINPAPRVPSHNRKWR